MKYLQRLFVLIIASAAIFSCQKEYSVEIPVGGNPSAQWEFKEAGVQFKGSIDSASIDTIATYKFMTLIGRSADGASQITLQVFGADLKPGTYRTPFSLFAYIKGGTPTYQTDQTSVDSFTIVITKIDSFGITGTFSGKALSGTESKAIVEGKFSAVLKGGGGVTPAPTDSGQVILWSKAGCGGGTSTTPIAVTIGNQPGQITSFYAAEPSGCTAAGAFIVKLPAGNYPWVAKCGTDSISGTVAVTKDGCTKAEVDFSAPRVGDYFPVTANSNWSYLAEGGSPADTLYVRSSGSTKVFGGNNYNLFVNDYGTAGSDSSYYWKSGNTYYEYYPADTSTGIAAGLQHIFLKDNVTQGNTWITAYSGSYQGASRTGAINDTLSQKLANYTVGAKTYADVLEVHTGYFLTLPAIGTKQIYFLKQWYAKGVGLIKMYQYDFSSGSGYTINLTRSRVN
ncbi:MAG: hypothetical protein ABIU63_06610 [Chitinophagaceae bacterium]